MKIAFATIFVLEMFQVRTTIAQDNGTPNDYLLSKWKLWFKILDVNNDGVISRKYFETSRHRFSELHHITEDEKRPVGKDIENWWNVNIFQGKYETISEQEFVDSLTNNFKADQQKFYQTMQNYFEILFNVADADGDGSLSEEECVIGLEAYDHKNVDLDIKFFKAYNPKHGLVPVDDIVASWVEFTTSEDKSKPSVEEPIIESGV